MQIEKTGAGYRIHLAAGGVVELWKNYSGTESTACAAIEYLLDQVATLRELADTVSVDRNTLQQLICNFCEEQEWAADTWKNQAHIKPLFAVAKMAKP